jgi:hypothetical protein
MTWKNVHDRIQHQAEPYGKLVSHYRALGIVPPASRKPASQ